MHHEVLAPENAGAGTVLLSAGLGGAGAFWQPQLESLAVQFQVITYDQRGTGQSRSDLPSSYSVRHMADDILEILDAHRVCACHFVGHALGGLIGLELALNHGRRIRSLVIVNGWAKLDPHTRRCFEVRLDLLRHAGPEAYVRAQPIFLYPAVWMSENSDWVERQQVHAIDQFQGAGTLLARIAALQAFDVSSRLIEISCPVLVAASRDDVLVPWTASKHLADQIPHARLWLISGGGHGFSVTDPAPFNTELRAFLAGL